eukprot:gene32654-42292_t
MSQDDLKNLGPSLGMGEVLDNHQSMKFNCTPNQAATTALTFPGTNVASFALTAGLIGCNGLVNNAPFSLNVGNQGDQEDPGAQFTGAYNNGSTYSALVQSGVSNPRGVLLIPFISNNINGSTSAAITGITTFSQIQSPFDTAPATSAPISLINLQVAVGGVNQLQNALNYCFENFIEQVSLYEKVNLGDLADLMTPRNINVTFTNNSNVTIDVMVFTEYFQEMTVDVETGLINK